MRILLIAFVAVIVAGCGSPDTDKADDSDDKNPAQTSSKNKDKQPRQKPAPPVWPPKFEFDASAFTDVPQAIEALRKAAGDEEQAELQKTTLWLAGQGAAAVQPLSQVVLDESATLAARHHACMALGYIAEPSVTVLIEVCDCSEPMLRMNAIKYLGLIRPADRDLWRTAVAKLVALMEHEEEATRIQAIQALGNVGLAAQNLAAAPLQAILDDPGASNPVRRAAGDAIKTVAPRKTFQD